MEIKRFQTVTQRTPWVKALIYGQAGAGKTRFCADSPKPFWFDFESSTETLRYWPEYKETRVKTPKDISELITDIALAVNDPEIDTIIIDSMTTAHDYFMRREAEKRAAKRDEFTFSEADYKYATQVFTKLFGLLQDAPINVVLIGHERISFDPDTGNVTGIYPDITPRLQQAVTRLVNVVGYMSATNNELKGTTSRKLYLNRTNTIEAKNRLNIQDIFIPNPTWKEIFGA